MLSYNLLSSVKFITDCYSCCITIYFESVDAFMRSSCNFIRFIKYIKNRFISNLPWSCRIL